MRKYIPLLFILCLFLSGEVLAQTPQPPVKPQPAKTNTTKPKPKPKPKGVTAVKAVKKDTAKVKSNPKVVDSITTSGLYLEVKEWNFGDIKEGDVVNHEFVFWNIGQQDLLLTDVKASCGCTTPGYSREPIKPGTSGIITVQYNSTGRPGTFSKTVTIRSNDPRHPGFQVLRIGGNVIPPAPPQGAPDPSPAH